eukprot:8299111-Ditylum_brightwellii.AAC.1
MDIFTAKPTSQSCRPQEPSNTILHYDTSNPGMLIGGCGATGCNVNGCKVISCGMDTRTTAG